MNREDFQYPGNVSDLDPEIVGLGESDEQLNGSLDVLSDNSKEGKDPNELHPQKYIEKDDAFYELDYDENGNQIIGRPLIDFGKAGEEAINKALQGEEASFIQTGNMLNDNGTKSKLRSELILKVVDWHEGRPIIEVDQVELPVEEEPEDDPLADPDDTLDKANDSGRDHNINPSLDTYHQHDATPRKPDDEQSASTDPQTEETKETRDEAAMLEAREEVEKAFGVDTSDETVGSAMGSNSDPTESQVASGEDTAPDSEVAQPDLSESELGGTGGQTSVASEMETEAVDETADGVDSTPAPRPENVAEYSLPETPLVVTAADKPAAEVIQKVSKTIHQTLSRSMLRRNKADGRTVDRLAKQPQALSRVVRQGTRDKTDDSAATKREELVQNDAAEQTLQPAELHTESSPTEFSHDQRPEKNTVPTITMTEQIDELVEAPSIDQLNLEAKEPLTPQKTKQPIAIEPVTEKRVTTHALASTDAIDSAESVHKQTPEQVLVMTEPPALESTEKSNVAVTQKNKPVSHVNAETNMTMPSEIPTASQAVDSEPSEATVHPSLQATNFKEQTLNVRRATNEEHRIDLRVPKVTNHPEEKPAAAEKPRIVIKTESQESATATPKLSEKKAAYAPEATTQDDRIPAIQNELNPKSSIHSNETTTTALVRSDTKRQKSRTKERLRRLTHDEPNLSLTSMKRAVENRKSTRIIDGFPGERKKGVSLTFDNFPRQANKGLSDAFVDDEGNLVIRASLQSGPKRRQATANRRKVVVE